MRELRRLKIFRHYYPLSHEVEARAGGKKRLSQYGIFICQDSFKDLKFPHRCLNVHCVHNIPPGALTKDIQDYDLAAKKDSASMASSSVKILSRILSFLIGVLMFIAFTIFHLGPSQKIFRIMIWFKHQKRAVKVKYVECNDYRFCYFSRGQPGLQPSLLMLHGFLFSKDMWLNAIKLFPKDLHLVCVDMPGHGETTCLEEENYAAAAQAEKIHQFVECIGLNRQPFHLVGISMGGMVAGLYAALYPSDVCCLSLLCPAGLRFPAGNGPMKQLKKRAHSTKPHSFLKLGFYNPSLTNVQLLKGYLEASKLNASFCVKYFLDISSPTSKHSLHDNLNKIKAPTQIIWGKNDQVIDPSGAEILGNAIANSQVHMVEKCGHFIVLDRPRRSAKLLLEFYQSVCGPLENKLWG
nr:monoacylglycerol lipase ABHD6-like [Pogona vitticeps]